MIFAKKRKLKMFHLNDISANFCCFIIGDLSPLLPEPVTNVLKFFQQVFDFSLLIFCQIRTHLHVFIISVCKLLKSGRFPSPVVFISASVKSSTTTAAPTELRSQPLQSVSTLEMDLSTASEVYCCLSAAVTKLYLLAQTYEALHACQNTVCIYPTLASNSPELTDKFLEDDF